MIMRFLFNVFFVILPYPYDDLSELKTIRKTFLIKVILRNYEYLNGLQGAVSS